MGNWYLFDKFQLGTCFSWFFSDFDCIRYFCCFWSRHISFAINDNMRERRPPLVVLLIRLIEQHVLIPFWRGLGFPGHRRWPGAPLLCGRRFFLVLAGSRFNGYVLFSSIPSSLEFEPGFAGCVLMLERGHDINIHRDQTRSIFWLRQVLQFQHQ